VTPRWQEIELLAERLKLDYEWCDPQLVQRQQAESRSCPGYDGIKPALLLLDEPTSGLDPLMQQEVYSLLREIREQGTTVFFSSHIIREVETIAERVAIIREGSHCRGS
jgi:ABC-2 type transport system ATP-binding protein